MATYDLTQSVPAPTALAAGDVLNCPYSGEKITITLPKGEYNVSVWGAQGGSYNESYGVGGKGGKSWCTATLSDMVTCYLYTGGKGSYGSGSATSINGGGFNGGGASSYRGGGGGGGSDVRFGADSLYSRGIVAGGGGGAYAYSSTYKADGGYAGGKSTAASDGAVYSSNYSAFAGHGANDQTPGAGGTGSSTTYNGEDGSFGAGGSTKRAYSTSYYSNGAGGGGWYGGGAAGNYYGNSRNRAAGGGGGNSYVYGGTWKADAPAGYMIPDSVTLTDTHSGAGASSFTDPDGSTVTGHAGNGYIRIEVVSVDLTPGTPTNLAASATANSATLTWTGVSMADSYSVYKNGTLVASGITATSYTFSGLDANTTYTLGVKSVNTHGSSSTATKSVTTVPDAPASLTVYGTTAREVLLTWPLAPAGSGLNVKLYRGTTLLLTADATTTNYYTDIGRSPGTSYTYKIVYSGTGGESAAVTATATTAATYLQLITDRTQADVDAVLSLSSSGYAAWSADQITEWNGESMKGAYNVSDILRVIDAMDYVAGLLNGIGFSITLQSTASGWTEAAERPTESLMAAYLDDLNAIYNAIQLFDTTPELPVTMEKLTYQKANDIEQILLDAAAMVDLYSRTMFPPSGYAVCGGDYL